MENYLLDSFVKNVTLDLITTDQNFAAMQKATKKLYKICKSNSRMLFWANITLLGTGGILYLHDKEIERLKKDVEQLKSGDESEIKAE